MAQALKPEKGLKKFQVEIEIHGQVYVITKEAPTYRDMVHEINHEFGNVMILNTIDLN